MKIKLVGQEDYMSAQADCLGDPRLTLEAKGIYMVLSEKFRRGQIIDLKFIIGLQPDRSDMAVDSLTSSLCLLKTAGYIIYETT